MNLFDGVTFLSPGRLWLLLGVGAVAVGYVVLQRRRRQYTVRFTNVALIDTVAPRRPGWRRHLPAAAFLIGLSAGVVAFAEPAEEVRVALERATIVLAIDVSPSMDAEDVEPNRLAAAQSAAKTFVESVPDAINVGLVVFDGTARVTVPPTTNHDQVNARIDELRLGLGTAIGEAIFASLAAIELAPEGDDPDEPVPAAIVVLSDGETTQGRPNEEGAAAAVEAGVPVTTISFGTPQGTIFLPGEGLIPVPVRPDALAAIAQATGGQAYEAASEGELRTVYEDIGSSIGYERERQEVTDRFVGYAIAALAAASVMSLVWFSRLP